MKKKPRIPRPKRCWDTLNGVKTPKKCCKLESIVLRCCPQHLDDRIARAQYIESIASQHCSLLDVSQNFQQLKWRVQSGDFRVPTWYKTSREVLGEFFECLKSNQRPKSWQMKVWSLEFGFGIGSKLAISPLLSCTFIFWLGSWIWCLFLIQFLARFGNRVLI